MTPNEIYALPTLEKNHWTEAGSEAFDQMMPVRQLASEVIEDYTFSDAPVEGERFLIELKLEVRNKPDWDSVKFSVATFDGSPFALILERSFEHDEKLDVFVTDKSIRDNAFQYMVSEIERVCDDGVKYIYPSDTNISGYSWARLVEYKGKVRAVNEINCNRADDRLIYDDEIFEQEYEKLAKAKKNEGNKLDLNKLDDRNQLYDLTVSGVVEGYEPVKINRITARKNWQLFALSDGVDCRLMSVGQFNMESFARYQTVHFDTIGPSSLIEVIKAFAENDKISVDMPAVAEVAAVFDITPEQAVVALLDWFENDREDVCEAVVWTMGYHSGGEGPSHDIFVDKIRYILENRGALDYCLNNFPDERKLEEWRLVLEKGDKKQEQATAVEVSTPKI